MQHNIVYKITNKVNGKIYIGVHCTDDLNDGYMGSGLGIKAAIKKYGIDNFTKEILVDYDSAEVAYRLEKMLVNEDFVKRRNTYNMNIGGKGGSVKGSRTAWNKGMTFTKEWIEKHHSHKPLSDGAKKKISDSKKGKPGTKHTDETKAKISKAKLGKPGTKHTDETKAKISAATKNTWAEMTDERKREIIQKGVETKRKKGLE